VKKSEIKPGEFDAAFTPNFGGEPRAVKTLASSESLKKFLSELSVPEIEQKRTMSEIESHGSALLSGVLVSQAELEETWPRI
jgi:hypothetical protein